MGNFMRASPGCVLTSLFRFLLAPLNGDGDDVEFAKPAICR